MAGRKKKKKKKVKIATVTINTPYDDAFRTMVTDCRQLLIPLINLVFGKNYDANEKVELYHNERFIHHRDGTQEKRVTDSYFVIGSDMYILECQSSADNTMIIRITEYGFLVALEDAKFTSENYLNMRFPRIAVLYLRSDTADDKMTIRVEGEESDLITYAHIIKMKNFTLEDIFEKKLYILLPFFAFNHEKDFEAYDSDPEKLEELKQEYVEILRRLNQARDAGEIYQIYVKAIVGMIKDVIHALASKYKNVTKGVVSVMGGKVLDYEGKSIYKEGHKDGIDEDRQRVARDMLRKNMFTLSIIAEISKLSEDVVRGIASTIGVVVK